MCHRNMAPLCRCEQVWASDVTTVMTYDYEIRIILLLVLLSYEISELQETGGDAEMQAAEAAERNRSVSLHRVKTWPQLMCCAFV